MKRRRPWTTLSSVVATAAAVVLSSGNLAVAVALALAESSPRIPSHLNLRSLQTIIELPMEQDVTSSPTLYVEPTVEPTAEPSAEPTKDDSTQAPSAALVKEAHPVKFRIALLVTDSVDLPNLLQDIANVMEKYIFRNLQALEEENPALSIKGVSLSVTAVARRHLRSLQITRTVNLDVQGGIQLDIRPTADNDVMEVLSNVSTKAEALLTAPNLKQAVTDATIDDVVAVDDENTIDTIDTLQVDQEGPTEPPLESNSAEASNNTTDDNRPSLLSIIFGFVLVAIATAGLVAYGYIFYRKRQKKLAKRRKMRESVEYKPPTSHKATTTPTRKSVAPTMAPPPTPPTLALPPPIGKIPNGDDENDSEGSSYKGIGSGSEDDAAGKDAFARELQTAASLDELAWEDFQQMKQRSKQHGRVISRNNSADEADCSPAHCGSLDMYSAQPSSRLPDVMPHDPEESPRFAKSFPYGDEEDEEFLTESGVEWTTEGIDMEGDSWEPYSSKVKLEIDRPKASTAASLAAIQAIERSMGQYGSEDAGSTNDDAALATSDAVQEVERLSRFVQRYEKKKERRVAREHERRGRSSISGSADYDELSGASRSFVGRSIDSAHGAEMSHLDTTLSESPRGMDSYSIYGSLRDEKKSETGAPSLLEQPSDMLSMDETEMTDYTTELHTMSEGNDVTQRLGITPFRVQKPVEYESDDDDDEGPISPMMQKLAQAEATRRAPREGDSLPTDEQRDDRRSQPQELNEQRLSRHQQLTMDQNDRRRVAQQQNGRRNAGPPQQSKSLTSLRGNSAIVENKPSKSLASLRNTNKAFLDNQSDANFSPSDEDESGGPSTARKPRSRLDPPPRELPAPTNPSRRRSGKFDNLLNLFETEDKSPIYPPDQHWQHSGNLSRSRSKSFGN
jgi:hypothetical protein